MREYSSIKEICGVHAITSPPKAVMNSPNSVLNHFLLCLNAASESSIQSSGYISIITGSLKETCLPPLVDNPRASSNSQTLWSSLSSSGSPNLFDFWILVC